MLRIALTLTAGLLMFTAPAAACAQEVAAPPKAPSPPEAPAPPARASFLSRLFMFNPIVIRLEYADCVEIAEIIQSLAPQSRTRADRQSNSVIYNGPEDTLDKVRRLIEELDRPPQDESGQEITMVPVLHREAGELAKQLRMIHDSRKLRIGADEAREIVLLKGAKSELDRARAVLKRLDMPAASAQIEFTFFHADMNSREPAKNTPADLADVVRELERFGSLTVLGRLAVTAVEREDFRVEGSIATNLEAQVEGVLANAAAEDAVKLQFHARLYLDKPRATTGDGKTKRRGTRPGFELETTVIAKRGDYIVLGSAPTGWDAGESVVLVLHVRP